MFLTPKSYSPAEFAAYVASLGLMGSFAQFVVRHNTGQPTLAERPQGQTEQEMLNMQSGWQGNGWHAGPHLVVDDNTIWVSSPLDAPGVHSPSWNSVSFGVEQLGDYNIEDYNSGRGLAVQQNAVAAIAILSHYAGIDSHSMRDHYQDPNTTHQDCPGTSCRVGRAAFMDAVHDYIVSNLV